MRVPRLQISLFGEPEIHFDGKPWPMRVPPATWPLLAHVTIHPKPLARSAVALALWPDAHDEQARANLRRHLHRLLRELPPNDQPWIFTEGKTVAWNRDAVAVVDVVEFERAVAQHRFADAVGWYAGDLIAGSFDESILEHRERLRAYYLESLERLMRDARRLRDRQQAIDLAEKLLTVDEWHEDALRTSVAMRYESGDRAGALARYERFAVALDRELNVSPMPETLALREAIVANQRLPFDEDAVERDGDRETGVPFIGRTAELQAVRNAWLRAARGRGSTIFISGEPGIGKSRLAGELADIVEAQGGRALVGRTSSPESTAFESIVEALREGLGLLSPGDLEYGRAGALRSLLPEAERLVEKGPVAAALGAESKRSFLLETIIQTFAAIGARRPLAIVLEDLHCAAGDTLELVDALAYRVAGLPIVLAITFRSGETDARHPLQLLRRRLAQQRRGQTIALSRLSRAEIEQLARRLLPAEHVSPELSTHVGETSEGNPLFAVQLLRYFGDAGRLPDARETLTTIGDAVISRVARLPERVRALTGLCASIESTFTVEELSLIGGWDESEVLDGLGALLDAKILCERGGDRFSYGFTHALIEAAVRESDDDASHRHRRRRIAEVIEATRADDPAAAPLVATHYQAAGETSRAAGAFLRAAQSAMERFAWEEALRFARRAGELSQDLSEQFIALHAGIEAAWRLGRVPEVWPDLDVLESMGERLGTAQRVASLLLRNTCAAVIAARSEQRRAIAAFEEIALETDNDAWRSEALFARAQLSSMEGRFSDAETELRAALEANESTGEHERLVRIRELLVQTLFRQSKLIEGRELVEVLRADAQTGSIREREAFLTGQIRLAVATEDPQAYRTARELALQHANYLGDVRSFIISTNELAYGSQLAWDTSGARAAYGQAIELARERGFVAYSVTATINLAHVELEVGHVDRAASLWHEARPPARRHELYISLICIAINLADVALRQGNLGEAMLEATSAYQMARERAEPRLVAEALSLLGAAETGQGAADAGLAHMREGLAIRRTLNSPRTLANELCSYAEALLLAGCTDEAIVIATELRDLTVADPEHQLSPGRICLVLARVAKAAGNLVEEERFRKLGRRVVDSVLRRLSDPEDRAAFAALPAHQFLMEVRA